MRLIAIDQGKHIFRRKMPAAGEHDPRDFYALKRRINAVLPQHLGDFRIGIRFYLHKYLENLIIFNNQIIGPGLDEV